MILLFFLAWGLGAGWLAHLVVQRHQRPNWGELFIAGVAGSFLGGLIGSLVSGDGLAVRPSGIVGSVVGAVVVLAVVDRVRAKRRRERRAAERRAARSGHHRPR